MQKIMLVNPVAYNTAGFKNPKKRHKPSLRLLKPISVYQKSS